ncbi:thioredoxin family protein [Geoglobus sp.]
MDKERIAIILATIFVLSGVSLISQQLTQAEMKKYPMEFYSLKKGLETAKKENKPVLVYIHSDTCHVCRAFLEDLSKYDDLKKAMSRFVVVKIDFNTERALAMKFGATGTPEFYILYPNGTAMTVNGKKLAYIGYSNTPDNELARKSFIAFLDYALQKFYSTYTQ